MDRHEEIINGILSFPAQIMELVRDIEEEHFITDFWSCIWSDFLHEKQTCTETWIVKASSYKSFNILLTHLSKAGWITSVLDANYAYITLNESKLLKWVTKEELIEVKRTYKFIKYRLGCTKSTWIDKVQLADKTVATGLIRKGFAKAGNNKFTYDVRFLTKYLHYVAINVCKGLTDSTKDVTYDEVIHELLNYYSNNNNVYTLGNNISDSRGRAIFQCMKKIFNPISCKDARALLICKAQHLTEEGMNFVFASIAELLAYRGDGKPYTFADKIKRGMDAYDRHEIPNINLDEDSDELHVIIWLQRIYENLDNYDGTNWVVPIEVDK